VCDDEKDLMHLHTSYHKCGGNEIRRQCQRPHCNVSSMAREMLPVLL
jgi:hypothetical protein